jgi:hypothetical protein
LLRQRRESRHALGWLSVQLQSHDLWGTKCDFVSEPKVQQTHGNLIAYAL